MEKFAKWLTAAKPVLFLVARRLAPPLLGAVIGLLGDAALLDGQLVAALEGALNGL